MIESLSIHHTGQPILDEKYRLSKAPYPLTDDLLKGLFQQYFLSPFEKVNEIYRFSHSSGNIQLNEICQYAAEIFEDKESFHLNSENIVKHLYEVSNHPKIKSGELYVAFFSNIQIEGEIVDAIGIFKSENKETYIKIQPNEEDFEVQYENEAINIKKLDKGCVIFNIEQKEGYKVAVIDHTNKGNDTYYWVDEFLQLKIRNDNFTQTSTALTVYKDFVSTKIDEVYDITKAEKIDLLNRSMNYFKVKDHFNMEEFSNEVIGDEKGIEVFKTYKSNYEREFDTTIPDEFSISPQAVKKQARVYKSILKLDKNFHVYIHGNNELIEKGFDQDRKMNYYKIYFKEEQ